MTVYTVYIIIGYRVNQEEYLEALGHKLPLPEGEYYRPERELLEGAAGAYLVADTIMVDNFVVKCVSHDEDEDSPVVFGLLIRTTEVKDRNRRVDLQPISLGELATAANKLETLLKGVVKDINPALHKLLSNAGEPMVHIVKNDCACCN